MNTRMASAESNAEDRLLRQCAIPSFSADSDAVVRTLTPEVRNWDWLIDQSIRHSILPLLFEHLQRAGTEGIPVAARERLRNLHYKLTARNASLMAELNRVLDILSGAGLRALPVKGPLLAVSCYGDLNRRRFDDLDLLMAADDILRARGILMQAGYRSFVNLPPEQLKAFIRAGWDVNLRQGEEEYSVDLSTDITPGFFCFCVPSEMIRDNSAAIEYEGRTYPAVAPELLLIMLAAHGTYHRWERLIWTSDVHAAIEAYPAMDTGKLQSMARRLGALRMLELALLTADRLAPLPPVFRNLITGNDAVCRLAVHPPDKIRYHLTVRERWRDRLCYLFRYFCAPTFSDWNAINLPRPLRWLYFLIRPVRIIFFRTKKPAQ